MPRAETINAIAKYVMFCAIAFACGLATAVWMYHSYVCTPK